VRKAKTARDEVLLDPHELSKDHTTSVNFLDVTPDGRTLVYGVRDGGQDEVVVKVLDVDTRQAAPDVLPRARYSGVQMTNDKRAIYYSRQTKDGPRVFVHQMGSDPAGGREDLRGRLWAREDHRLQHLGRRALADRQRVARLGRQTRASSTTRTCSPADR
jgi:hypothetical protein